jgi:5'-3' exonuclease
VRVHLVDGTWELFRAHFSKRPPRTDPDGRDVKATTGLLLSLLAMLEDSGESVTHIAVAFDNPIRSFRNQLFPDYKSDEGVAPELRGQFDLAEEATRALGVRVWSMKDFEADDGLAAGAALQAGAVEQVRIMACDKDLLQCVRGRNVVVVDRMRDREMDEDFVRTQKGIAPRSIPDWLALVGDTADGIPGLPGFGEKGAAAVLAAFERLESIPDQPARWPKSVRGADRLCATLRERREDALLYRTLATLRTDAPVIADLASLEYAGAPREEWHAFCDALAIGDLRTRPRAWR